MQTTRAEVVPQMHNAFAHDPHAYRGAGGQRGEPTERVSVLNRVSNVSEGVRMKPVQCSACGGIGHVANVCPSVNAF